MYKKGITLIETVVYLALLSVVSMIFMGSIYYYKQKERELSYNREIENVKEFIILQVVKSTNENSTKTFGIVENQIYDKKTKERVKLLSWKIDTGNLISKEFHIIKCKLDHSFKLTLKGDKNDTYEIQVCKKCQRLHI